MGLYKILKVAKTATQEDIKTSYRVLAKENHPDRGGDPALMAEISTAYSILSDPEKRKKYDETGKLPESQTIEFEANALLNMVLSGALSAKDVRPENIISKCESIFKENERRSQAEIESSKSAIEILEKIRAKKCKINKKDTAEAKSRKQQFSYIIDQEIKKKKDHLEKVNRAIEAITIAKEMIKCFMDEDDQRVWSPTYSISTSPNATWY